MSNSNTEDALIFNSLSSDRFEHLKILLENGASINSVDLYGNSPLMASLTIFQFEVSKFLIDANTDLTITNKRGKTALDIFNDVSKFKNFESNKNYRLVEERLKLSKSLV